MKLAVIVPYRDREAHLQKFLPHITKYLKHYKIGIFIIEQRNAKPFNRGLLLNIGFLIAERAGFDYCALHDVDMLPTNADYSYPEVPTHIATKASQFNYRMPVPDYFGGVTLFRMDHFRLINGFPNKYWGWGGEDDDLLARCQAKGINIARRVCWFRSLPHKRAVDPVLHQRNVVKLLKAQQGKFEGDGVTNCRYKIEEIRVINKITTLYQVNF